MNFSHTKLQTYLDCERKFKNKYILKYELRKRPNYFVLGSAVHRFIEIFYRSKDPKLAARQIEVEFGKVDRTTLNRDETHQLEVDKNIALGIAGAYPGFYKGDFDEFETFLTEQDVKMPFPKSYDAQPEQLTYQVILDLLAKDHAGDWWVVETKTASPQSLTADYFTKVKLDSQVMGEMWAAKEVLGVFPRGVIYNVIKKPGIRLKKGETLQAFQKRVRHEYEKFATEKQYFTRQQYIIDERRLKEWHKEARIISFHIWDKIHSAKKHKQNAFWPMNTGNCTNKFGACPYLNACAERKFNKVQYVKYDSKR